MSHPAEPTNLHAILRTRLLTAAGIGRSIRRYAHVGPDRRNAVVA
jgi:hypothetical protein